MSHISDIAIGKSIGYRANHGSTKYIWQACINCGKERWVVLEQLKRSNNTHLCGNCSRRRNGNARKGRFGFAYKGNYKGGRYKSNGYVFIRVYPDDFFYPMATKDGYVQEHRLIVAKALGRNLHPWEIVHHKEGFAKDDNRYPGTLQLVMEGQHNQITIMENRIKHLGQRVTLLESDNILLREQLEARSQRVVE